MIPRSSYYKWLKRQESVKEVENKTLIAEIIKIYNEVDGIYGYRRITLNLNRRLGKKYNHKRIYRLMKLTGLKSVIRKKKKKYIKSNADHVAQNILNREFSADSPNKKWVTDVTEFKYGNGRKAYLSAILDLYDNTIVSYVLGHSNDIDLTIQTLNLALIAAPKATPLLHSDRGFQYTSHEFKSKVDYFNIQQSMSRVGRCIDNGPIEAFWGTLKCEKYNLNKYNTFNELSQDIDKYIKFYNNERLQKKLNGLSPSEYRALAT